MNAWLCMTEMRRKPQTEHKHPEPWADDLSPDRMAGQNIGGEAEAQEVAARTAQDVKAVHRALTGFNDDELKEIPVLEPGTRLRQGATYLDLSRGPQPFTATGDMSVRSDQAVVPKDRVPYWLWNRLVGEEKP
jgi:hypothetical protein